MAIRASRIITQTQDCTGALLLLLLTVQRVRAQVSTTRSYQRQLQLVPTAGMEASAGDGGSALTQAGGQECCGGFALAQEASFDPRLMYARGLRMHQVLENDDNEKQLSFGWSKSHAPRV